MSPDSLRQLHCPTRPAQQAREHYSALCARMGSENETTWYTATCWICKHSVHAHYATAGGGGCIATTPAGWTLAAGHNGERPQSAFIGDSAGNCLCPGYQLGGLPPAVTDTLRGLDAHDDELCEGCLHPLQNHGDVDPANQPYGCWACPCGHNEILEESVFEIPRAEVRISVGWITLRMSGSDSIVMQLRMPDLGLSTTISTLDRFWSDLSLRRPCEVATALTDCWQHEVCAPDHVYRVRFVPRD